MWRGIEQVKPGARLGDIGHAIQTFVEERNFSVVREYCGHGIGRVYHEDPQVLHYGEPGTGDELRAGMTFTIEPMVNAGKRHVRLLGDGWTVVTKDHSLSAQWEHTILVTATGYEVLTLGQRSKRTARQARWHHSTRTSRRRETTVLRSSPWLRLAQLPERLAAAEFAPDAFRTELQGRARRAGRALPRRRIGGNPGARARRAHRRHPARGVALAAAGRLSRAGRWRPSAATVAASCIRIPTSTS